jgi:hypothetical protein
VLLFAVLLFAGLLFAGREQGPASPSGTSAAGHTIMEEARMDSAAEFTLLDQAGRPWDLAEHLDGAAVLIFYRGDC